MIDHEYKDFRSLQCINKRSHMYDHAYRMSPSCELKALDAMNNSRL